MENRPHPCPPIITSLAGRDDARGEESGPCDAATLKAAYRRRSMETHPDRGGTTEEMARVNAAYDRLSKMAR